MRACRAKPEVQKYMLLREATVSSVPEKDIIAQSSNLAADKEDEQSDGRP